MEITENVTPVNREHWLSLATEMLTPLVQGTGLKMPKAIKATCGWPSTRGTSTKNRTIGQCFVSGSAGGTKEIFISPVLDDSVEVLATLLHEIGHACLPAGTGHKAPFARFCKSAGLGGKPTATYCHPEEDERQHDLHIALRGIIEKLGTYPHDKISLDGMPKQTTRLLKVICPHCGYTARITRTWVDVGLPTCTCGTPMVEDQGGDADDEREKLEMVQSIVEYQTGDKRFSLRRTTEGRDSRFILTDYEAGEDGSEVAITRTESFDEALDLMEVVRDGIMTLSEHAADESHDDEWDDIDDGTNPLEDYDIDYIPDAMDETPEHPEDQPLPDDADVLTDLPGFRAFVTLPATESELAEIERQRDESGTRKSQQIIAAGGEGAMD